MGVTFLELLVVVSILSVLMLFAIPSMRGSHERNKLLADARKLVSLIRYARSTAVLHDTDVILEIDVDKGRCRLDLGKAATPESKTGRDAPASEVELWQPLNKDVFFAAVFSWDSPDRKLGLARIKFYSDGSASDSTIVLENKYQKHMTVAVNRATGDAEAFSGAPADWQETAQKS